VFRRQYSGLTAIVCLAAVYYLAGELGLSLASVNKSVTLVWPPTGIALAAVLLFGYRLWPGVFLGAFLLNLTTSGSLPVSACIAAGNTLEAVAGGWLVRRFASGTKVFDRAFDIFRFVILAAMLSTAISAATGATSISLGGFARWQDYPANWLTWWLSDAFSAIFVTPLLVIWGVNGLPRMNSWRWMEAGVLVAATVLVSQIAFADWLVFSGKKYPLPSVIVPFFMWAAFRFGLRGVSVVAFVWCSLAVSGTLRGLGPFALGPPNESLPVLQAYMGMMMVSALVLAAALAERQRAEEKTRESEKLFRQLAESIREVFWMTNLEKTEMVYISPGYEQIWGRSCASLYASPQGWLTAIHPEDRERIREAALTRQVRGDYHEEYRIVRPDGSIRWIRDRAFPVRDESGSIYRIAGIAEDITERKRAELQLTTLAHAVESTAEMICITDLEDRFTFVNRAFQNAYGYTEAEIIGKTCDVLFSPGNPARLMEEILEQSHSGGWRGELIDLRKDGTEFPIFLSTSQIKDRTGRVIGLMGVAQDITERKQAEAQSQQLASVVQSSNDAIISATKEGVIVSWNQAAERIFGYTANEAIGNRISIVIPPDRLEEAAEVMRKAALGEKVVNFEAVRRRKDGTLFEATLTVSPVRNAAGETAGISAIVRDITEKKQLEQTVLEISMAERRRLGHELHDGLGQHLAGVAFKAKILEESLRADTSSYVREAHDVVAFINDAISQTRRLARGLDPIEVEASGLAAALQSLASETEKGFEVRCRVSCSEPLVPVSRAAGAALFRIAQEAIHNAIVHGEASELQLELAIDNGCLLLMIRDNGKGFQQQHKKEAGMGLRIMQYRAHSIGGSLKIIQRPERGVEVCCQVPQHSRSLPQKGESAS
jgi:PAS domain S-box-containing protein